MAVIVKIRIIINCYAISFLSLSHFYQCIARTFIYYIYSACIILIYYHLFYILFDYEIIVK